MNSFKSNGKLLISGEYAVLDGALSLAIPTKYGQSLDIEPIDESKLLWKSIDEKGNIWFETELELDSVGNLKQVQDNNDSISKRLIQILDAAQKLNNRFLKTKIGLQIITRLDFPRDWGLGTSSTLINNIANWAYIDPYKLLKNTFGGSGYDIACAQNNTAITYQLQKGIPNVNTVDFNPIFKDNLYFIHLNKKQNSRDGIKHYNINKENFKSAILDINDITLKMIVCNNLSDFESLINKHENIISKLIKQTPVKTSRFNDFNGSIKSLGAWGGDFILATSKESPNSYFKDKGFKTIISYKDMIL